MVPSVGRALMGVLEDVRVVGAGRRLGDVGDSAVVGFWGSGEDEGDEEEEAPVRAAAPRRDSSYISSSSSLKALELRRR